MARRGIDTISQTWYSIIHSPYDQGVLGARRARWWNQRDRAWRRRRHWSQPGGGEQTAMAAMTSTISNLRFRES